jgi:hypothetical protein
MKKIMKSLMALVVAFMGISTAANADVLKRDTVYVIPSMEGTSTSFPISAYKVENDGNLTHVKTVDVNTTRWSAVGLAVCTKNKRIFVSHEGFGTIEVLDGETFERLPDLVVEGTSNIAGMVFSEDRGRLYVVDRDQTDIFVYRVNALGNVERVQSEEFNATSGVWAVDVWGDKLYCTHGFSDAVTVYDLNSKAEITADSYTTTNSNNMAIAVDGSDSSQVLVYTTWTNLYTGSGTGSVTQKNVNTGDEKGINLLRSGRGLSVNPALGHVYAVTGDDTDGTKPELRTYGENQFTSTPGTPTPLDSDGLMLHHSPTDVFAAGITFNPSVFIEMIDPADKNLTAGKDVTFEITIKNPSSEYNMTIHEMEDLYNTDDISFISSSLTPDDTVDDGNISWSGLDITIAPDANYTFTKTFTALREVNCSTETIQVTDAEHDMGEPVPVEPFGNTLYFDIGPSCGCDPKLDSIGGGCTYNPNSKSFDMMYIFMMLAILFGGLAMRRKKTF